MLMGGPAAVARQIGAEGTSEKEAADAMSDSSRRQPPHVDPADSPGDPPETLAPARPSQATRDQVDAPAEPAAGRPPLRPFGAPIRAPRSRIADGAAPAQALERRAVGRARRVAKTAFINRNFALLWWGQTVSSVGDYAWDTALVLWIAAELARNQSSAPLQVSGVILAAAIPQIVVGPVAGVFVDRWDKRRTMVVTTALQAILAMLLILPAANVPLPFIGHAHLPVFWLLSVAYADVALITSCAQFFLPAQLALVKDIVPDAKQDQALEMTQAIQGLAVIIGPPVAAVLVFGLGVQWALLLNALSFAVSFLAAVAIQAPPAVSSLAPGETSHFSREFFAGVGYVLSHHVLRTILVAEVLTWLGFGALQTLGYFFITGNLHAPATAYGLFGAIFGLGAVAGGALVTLLGQRIGLTRVLWIALVTAGTFVIVMSHLTSLAAALVAAFLFGVTATSIIIVAGPLAVDATERAFVGRVTAVINPVGRLAAFFSVIIAGYLVSVPLQNFHASVLGIIHFGPVNTVFTFTGLLAVAGGLYARASLGAMMRKGVGQKPRSDSDASADVR
jgi:MFS family permease